MAEPEELDMDVPDGVLDGPPIYEPKLTQLDEWTRQQLESIIYEFGYIKSEDGRQRKVIAEIIYPDLVTAMSYAVSHLNMVMNYTHYQGMAAIEFWEGYFYDPLFLMYKRNNEALYVLNTLNSIIQRSILGGSIGGTHQGYNVKMAGGDRLFRFERRNGER